jgi:hypothetical protein
MVHTQLGKLKENKIPAQNSGVDLFVRFPEPLDSPAECFVNLVEVPSQDLSKITRLVLASRKSVFLPTSSRSIRGA